jgi:hypothetical protein
MNVKKVRGFLGQVVTLLYKGVSLILLPFWRNGLGFWLAFYVVDIDDEVLWWAGS